MTPSSPSRDDSTTSFGTLHLHGARGLLDDVTRCLGGAVPLVNDPRSLDDLVTRVCSAHARVIAMLRARPDLAAELFDERGAREGVGGDSLFERFRAHFVTLLTWGIHEGLLEPRLDVVLASLVGSAALERVARDLVQTVEEPADVLSTIRGIHEVWLRGLRSAHRLGRD